MKSYKLESMRRYKLRGKYIRILRWFKSPIRCKLSHHIPDYGNYGFVPGDNKIDMRCELCENRIIIAVDDMDNKERLCFSYLIKVLRNVNVTEKEVDDGYSDIYES